MENSTDLKLKGFVEKIESLNAEKQEISSQIKDVYNEAKSFGFNTKVIREIIKKRKMDTDERVELEQLTEVYKESLGMLG